MQYIQGLVRKDDFEEDYLKDIPAFKEMSEMTFQSPVTFLVGENGSGKSTLLEAMAVAYGFNPEGGSKNFSFHTRQTHSSLYKHLTLIKGPIYTSEGFFLRAESFYNVASEIEEVSKRGLFPSDQPDEHFLQKNYGGNLHHMSHGESFLSLVMNRFKENSVFFLDEPEAALSPTRQLALLARIDQLVKEDCQFFIATHSPILMGYPNSEIYLLDEKGIEKTEYEDTEHYHITKSFLNNPSLFLKELFD